jgi:hypothetical protein
LSRRKAKDFVSRSVSVSNMVLGEEA